MTEPSYRLAAPAPGAFETSPGEQAVLRGIDLKNIGGMYGLLLGQQGRGREAQAQYVDQLNASNEAQAGLSRAALAQASRESDQRTALGFIQHGGMGLREGLQAAQLPGLAVNQDAATTARNIISADDLRRLGQRGGALKDIGSGLYNMAQAGVNVNEGQALATPDDAAKLGMTTGAPLAIRLEDMQQRGANARAAAKEESTDGEPKMKIKIDPLSQMPTLEQTGGDVSRQARNAAAFNKWVREGGFREGRPFSPGTSASAVTGGANPLLGPLPDSARGELARTARQAPGRTGNMDTARGATPPATQQGTPAPRTAAPAPTDGTAPPSIVEKARAYGTGRTRWKDGHWYAVLPNGKYEPLE